jgi:hypothetical protein
MPDKTRGFLMASNFSPIPYKNSKLILNLVEAACRNPKANHWIHNNFKILEV